MELWEGIGGEKTGPEPTARLSCLPRITSPSGIQPHPQQEPLPTDPPLEGGCHQAPGGRWLPNSPGTGVRMETSHQPPQEEEEIIRVIKAQLGWVLREEQGAGAWVWVTPPAPEPLLSGVLGGLMCLQVS